MGSRFFGSIAALVVITSLLTAPAGRAAEGEDPRCGPLQAQQLQLTREIKILTSDLRYAHDHIVAYRERIKEAEEEAVARGKSRTGNITNETGYYKRQIAEFQHEEATKAPQLRAAEQRLAYVKGRQSVYNCNLSFDLSGEWTLTWTWSVTSVDFVGNVSGGAGHWTFAGTLEGGGNASWSPKKGSGNVNCTLSGKVGAEGTIECSASFVGPPPGTWTGQAKGSIEPMSSRTKRNFKFLGRNGRGTSTGQPPAGIDVLQLSPKD